MKILAIDTSCDDSCAALIDTQSWKLLGECVISHASSMVKFGGVVPEIASREHIKGLPVAVHQTLEQAKIALDEVDWFAVTNRPGLIGALLVGVSFAKALAFAQSKPFSVFSHLEAHLFSPFLESFETPSRLPPFPWLTLVVSGGHTELFFVEGIIKYRWIGGTLDDAAGEAFDKIGKQIGIPYPAGPELDRWVREKATDTHRSEFSFPRSKPRPHHFSFSGLKTAVALSIKNLELNNEEVRLSIAASAQEAIVDALVDQISRSQQQFPKSALIVTGGVACNSRLRVKLPDAYFPKPNHCTDNAAMVAMLAALYEREGILKPDAWDTSAHATQTP